MDFNKNAVIPMPICADFLARVRARPVLSYQPLFNGPSNSVVEIVSAPSSRPCFTMRYD